MAEVGNMGLPPKLLKQGITDMVRISDARMSGTAFGTVVLHVAPEAMDFGPLAAVENGDEIVLDATRGLLQLEVSDAEIERRLAARREYQTPQPSGGYLGLYHRHVLQADEGCDFDFLVGCRGADVPAHSH
jgi:dihydroxyacid dehydratase/phosphogluconate dehydratase